MEIKKEDIEHLATLARIKLTKEEAATLAVDITNIIEYVSDIEDITSEIGLTKEVGPLSNVMREDGEPHEGGIYSEDLLSEAPERDGDYIKVKKILGDE